MSERVDESDARGDRAKRAAAEQALLRGAARTAERAGAAGWRMSSDAMIPLKDDTPSAPAPSSRLA